MPPTHDTVVIPSATRHLSEVRRFVERVAAEANLPGDILFSIQLAVDEACANIIEHAYKGRADGLLQIDALADGHTFAITIRHEGDPFHPELYHPPTLDQAIEARRRRGYGLRLIHRLVDEVQFQQNEGTNAVRLSKRYA